MEVVEAFELNNSKITSLKLNNFIEGAFEHPLLNVYDIEITDIIGFGGAFTEASAYNYSKLNENEKNKVLEALFGESGLHYRLGRICVGSSDFCLNDYCYQENEDSMFSISRDKKFVIPFIKDVLRFTNNEIKFLASPWSPPAWMKNNKKRNFGGKLLPKYYEKYANYIISFIKEYAKEGIKIEYLSIQNEPKARQTWESCEFTSEDEINLAKVIKSKLILEGLDVKLLCWDHNKERMVEKAQKCLAINNLFYGIGYHWYSGDHFDAVSLTRKLFPNSIILETEFCKSFGVDETTNDYSKEYVNGLKSGSNGFIEWNLITDENGGPYHYRKSGCLAPITFKNNSIELSSNYFQTWMYSHFIKNGAKSLATSSYNENVKISAVKNPNGEIIVNMVNNYKDEDVALYIFGKFLKIRCLNKCSYLIRIKK